MKSEYVLAGAAERDRLYLQAKVWESEAEALFDQIHPGAGSSSVDLGCGAMGVLGPLAKRAAPGGRVVGVERDPAMLAGAREYVAAQQLENVEILEAMF